MTERVIAPICEIASESAIAGRRPIKVVLHEIFPDDTSWQENGVSWNEEYTRLNLHSVVGMSIVAEFLTEDRDVPYGHGKDGVKIDRAIYTIMVGYIRDVHRFKKNRETGFDAFTKDCMIEDDRDERARNQKRPFRSVLLPFASYLSLKIGFDAVWKLPVGAFFYDMSREQKTKDHEDLMRGIYSGCIDIKKINKKDLSLWGDID